MNTDMDDRWLVNVRDREWRNTGVKTGVMTGECERQRVDDYRCGDRWLVNVRDREWMTTDVVTDGW